MKDLNNETTLPDLDIIIVNWNSGDYLYRCLKSITAARNGIRLNKIIIIDNASTDHSLSAIKDINLPIRLIKNNKNIGFAAACNQGARYSKSKYLLFLNPDTKLSKDSLVKSINFMEDPSNKKIGILGVQLIGEEGQILRTCCRIPNLGHFLSKILGLNVIFPHVFKTHYLTDWNHEDSRVVDHVMGSFYLVRRFLFEKLDGFDERFFVYLEDLDFSFRAKKIGYSCYYLSTTKVYHKGGGSSEKDKTKRLFYSLRSRILYGYKHFTWISATILCILTLTIEPLTRIIYSLLRMSLSDISIIIGAYKMLWKEILSTKMKRK